jgi:CBS domain-containing protein
MANSSNAVKASRLVLTAETAADLMTRNPVSISADATVPEAIDLLVDKGISAAPVIDGAGRPVGVLSHSDILVHDREKVDFLRPLPEYYQRSDSTSVTGDAFPEDYRVENADAVRVKDLMTPAVFSVTPEAPAARVVEDMVALKVHRLFVVDRNGVLVGVISALDVLRSLSS